MSPDTHPLTWSELDRLADYTAGILDATEAAQVAQLIQSDSRWAGAWHALTQANAAVRADLAAAAAAPIAIPEDVAARLDDAIATAGRATVISLAEARGKSRSSWRRRTAMAGIAAAAAAFVAVAGGVVLNSQLTTGAATTASAPEAQADRNSGAAPPALALPSPGFDSAFGAPAVVATGMDYRLDTLRELSLQPAGGTKANATPGPLSAQEAPGALARLTTPSGLADCLRTVTARYPGTAVLLDYARFDGDPALIIVVRQGSAFMIVAVGSECGVAGTDEKAAVTGA
jgi:anti-sigma factor RsiW